MGLTNRTTAQIAVMRIATKAIQKIMRRRSCTATILDASQSSCQELQATFQACGGLCPPTMQSRSILGHDIDATAQKATEPEQSPRRSSQGRQWKAVRCSLQGFTDEASLADTARLPLALRSSSRSASRRALVTVCSAARNAASCAIRPSGCSQAIRVLARRPMFSALPSAVKLPVKVLQPPEPRSMLSRWNSNVNRVSSITLTTDCLPLWKLLTSQAVPASAVGLCEQGCERRAAGVQQQQRAGLDAVGARVLQRAGEGRGQFGGRLRAGHLRRRASGSKFQLAIGRREIDAEAIAAVAPGRTPMRELQGGMLSGSPSLMPRSEDSVQAVLSSVRRRVALRAHRRAAREDGSRQQRGAKQPACSRSQDCGGGLETGDGDAFAMHCDRLDEFGPVLGCFFNAALFRLVRIRLAPSPGWIWGRKRHQRPRCKGRGDEAITEHRARC